MRRDQQQVFRTKVDAWLVAVVSIAFGAGWMAVARVKPDGLHPLIAAEIALALAFGLVAWIFVATDYEVTADRLIVRSGPIHTAVPLASVRRLRATHNPLSAPALSFDRIEVLHDSGRILISPRDKRGFVNAILARAPGVVVDGRLATLE